MGYPALHKEGEPAHERQRRVAGITLSMLVRIEHNEVDPRFSSIPKLTSTLGVHAWRCLESVEREKEVSTAQGRSLGRYTVPSARGLQGTAISTVR